MPPKKAAGGAVPSKKTENKKKEKIIEDKTFGLKNKKGAKTQKFVQHVEKQVKFGNANARTIQLQQEAQNSKKTKAQLEKEKLAELSAILKPVATQKIEKGVDPKSVLCAFFKQGTCTKGERCKFSHDVGVERKSEKKSLYDDVREGETGGSMADWDEAKLAEVVEKKHGEANKAAANTTEIICKFFIEAVEASKYGWFWECPNGGKECKYRHALPPGFVLKKDSKKDGDKDKDQVSIEELVEKERAKLGYDLPKINLDSFKAWKLRKIAERRAKAEKEQEKRRQEFKAGRNNGLSGRDMFTFNPDLADDGEGMDEGEGVVDSLMRELDEDDEQDPAARGGQVREIDLDQLARYNEMQSTVDAPVGKRQIHSVPTERDRGEVNTPQGVDLEDDAEPTSSTAAAARGAEGGIMENGVAIDEDLFGDDQEDDDELEELEEGVNDLQL